MDRRSRLNPTARAAGAFGALCLLVGALAWSATAAAHLGASTSGCSDPVANDPYDGYRVGVPAGWSVFHFGGRLVISPSATAPQQSIVEPVLLTHGLTPEAFFTSYMHTLDSQIDAAGNAMSFHITSVNGGIPSATLSGRAGSVPEVGRATVLVLPDQTAYGSEVAVLSAYWAPPSEFNSQSAELAGVALCYAPERAPLFRIFKDQVFTYAMPPNFEVKSEGQDFLEVADGNTASASFLLTLLPASDGVTSIQSLTQYVLSHEGIRVSTVLSSSVSPAQAASDNALDQAENLEFLGMDGSIPVHGLVSVESSILRGVDASGVLRLAMTKTADWNSVGGAVIRIAAGIQHSFAQDLAQWERLSVAQQQFGQQVEGFDQALNGEDLVEDPSTGEAFEAPYNSYSQSGPDGPGYYSGSPGDLQKLQVITPS